MLRRLQLVRRPLLRSSDISRHCLIALTGGLFGAPKSDEAKKDGTQAGMQIHYFGLYFD